MTWSLIVFIIVLIYILALKLLGEELGSVED